MLLSPKSVDNPVFNLSHYPSTALPYWHQVKMSNNWPTFVQDNYRYPETVEKALDRLMELLNGEGSKLLDSFNQTPHPGALYCSVHPNDASEVIIGELWRRLQDDD